MAGPVFKTFRLRPTAAFFALSDEEQNRIGESVQATVGAAGGKVIAFCDCRWSSESWAFWGVEEYPSLEALQEQNRQLTALGWYRYVEAETLLGTPYTGS